MYSSAQLSSWLDRKGRFHCIERGTNHQWLSHSTWALRNGTNIQTLFDRGWMRVVYIGDELYISNDENVKPNNKQKDEIVNLALFDGRFNKVIYEGHNHTQIIWECES